MWIKLDYKVVNNSLLSGFMAILYNLVLMLLSINLVLIYSGLTIMFGFTGTIMF